MDRSHDLPIVPTRASASRRVLLIADDPEDIAALADVIAAQGHQLLQAGDGRTGIELARRQPPDLIILNVKASVELLTALRKSDDTRDVPIVVTTASAGKGQQAIEAGGDDVYTAEATAIAAFADLIARLLLRVSH